MGDEENRVHARIHVSTKIDVAGPDGIVEAELKDVSKGGARFFSPASVGLIGETVELFLPALDGSDIAVMAQIIRNELHPDGRMVAVRFDAVEPAMAKALSDLIELLLSSTREATVKSSRATRRIEVRFTSFAELHGILQDIADGGLLMTIAEALSLYEDVDVIVPDLGGVGLLTLHGRITHQRKVPKDDGHAYQVGLDFQELRPEARACVEALLGQVAEQVATEPPPNPEGEGDSQSDELLDPPDELLDQPDDEASSA